MKKRASILSIFREFVGLFAAFCFALDSVGIDYWQFGPHRSSTVQNLALGISSLLCGSTDGGSTDRLLTVAMDSFR